MATITPSVAGGVWSANATWTGGVPPTAADDVVFHAGAGNVTIDGTSGSPSLCRSLDLATFAYAGTLTHAASKQLNIGDGSGGSLKLVAGATYIPSSTSVLKFVSTAGGNNITWAGKSPGQIIFDGVGGAWQFQDAFTSGGTSPGVTLTNGALDTNSKACAGDFNSANSNTRSFTLGTTTWNLGAASLDISTSTGMTLSAASSTFQQNSGGVQPTNFKGGGLTYGTYTSTLLTTGACTFSGSNTFGTLTLSISSTTKNTTSGYALTAGTTQTVTGTFTANGNSTILRNFIYGTTIGTAATISAATVTVTHTDFRDIAGAGAGSWNFSGLTTTANGDAGGNSGITFTAPKNCFMKTAVSVNWSGSNWFTLSGGSIAIVPAMPLVHDNCKFDINSVTAGLKTITLDVPRIPDTDWTGVANTPAFAFGSNAFEIYGSLILVSGMTRTGSAAITFMGRSSYTLDGGAITFAIATAIVNAPGGTLTLARNINTGNPITLTAGTLDMGGFTSTWAAISIGGGTWTGTGAITGSTFTQSGGTITLGGTMTLTGAFAQSAGTFNNNNFGVTGHTTFAVSGGTLNLSGQFNGSSTITVSAGTINDSGASGELKGTTASFTGGTSVVRKMTLSSTFAMSSTAGLTIPAGGSATWATSWTVTGTTCSLKYGGQPTFSSGALNVAGGYIPSLEAL